MALFSYHWFKLKLSPAVIFWHDDHAWTNTGHNATNQSTGLRSSAFSTKTIVQTTLLTIQIGFYFK